MENSLLGILTPLRQRGENGTRMASELSEVAHMTKAEIFNDETRYTGGRLPYERLPDPVRSAYSDIADRAADLIGSAQHALPRLPPIHFDFIHDGRVSALAFKAKGDYFVGITTGAVYMLRMVIGRMLSDGATFAFVGQPAQEALDVPPLSNYRPDADAMHDMGTNILTPRDSVRASYAWYLQDQAIMFLLGHEISHITRGHVDYLTTERGAGFTAPLSWFWNKGENARFERQCLEADADRGSIISRIDSLRLTFSSPDRPVPPWSRDAYDEAHVIRDWAVSMSIVFRLFGDMRFSRSELNGLAYPPWPIRQVWCEMHAFGATQELWDASLGQKARLGLLQGRNYVEAAFAHILGEPVSDIGVKLAMSKTGQDHMQRITDQWNEHLRLSLDPFTYEW